MTTTGEVVTFYSYKGGTGRTMALANAAVLFAREGGREVLAMDWDLEAPGLHRFFTNPAWSSAPARPGTLDLLHELTDRVMLAGGGLELDEGLPLDEEATQSLVDSIDLERYVVSVAPGLSVIWAGRAEDSSYAQRVSELDWDGLYLRAPYLFTALARALTSRYRYVLVDSRTGLSDTSGVCTAILPEKLVVVFTPNQQSVDGALHRARLAVTYRRQSDDLRRLVVFPLASRVELSEEPLRRRWRYGGEAEDGVATEGYEPRFEKLLGEIYSLPECDLHAWFDEVQIQQAARFAFGEDIAVMEEGAATDRLSLARSYAGFARALDESDAPWKIQRQSASGHEADGELKQATLARLHAELHWHSYRASLGRRRLLRIRLLQLMFALAAVAASFLPYFTEIRQGWPFLVAAGVLAGGLEGIAIASGSTQWRRHGALATSLSQEEHRYLTGARGYVDPATRDAVLAERVEDILDQAYGEWHDRSGLAPLPAHPDWRSLSERDRARD
jgi:cellulose biosynthesis protein BcsQ